MGLGVTCHWLPEVVVKVVVLASMVAVLKVVPEAPSILLVAVRMVAQLL
jgi:hypothetical protein